MILKYFLKHFQNDYCNKTNMAIRILLFHCAYVKVTFTPYCSLLSVWWMLLFSHPVCLTLCDPIDCSMLGLPVPHRLLEFTQVHVHCISDDIQPPDPLTPSSPSALNLSQHQELFQWVGCSRQMTKILEFQLQHRSFQEAFRVDFP